jgi:hypothetical protein
LAAASQAKAKGFRTLALVATLPGIPLYEHYGFRVSAHQEVTMPDGVMVACASMEKSIT